MRRNRLLAVATAAALVVSSLAGGAVPQAKEETAKAATYNSVAEDMKVFDNYNASEITVNMGAGWNLGNQLECPGNDETKWGNPVITQETINMVKDAGFKTIRIPVSYYKSIGEGPEYTIDAAWLARIKEVVDYAMNAGLYTIINMHGDGYYTTRDAGAWLLCAEDDEAQVEIKAKYEACWAQIGGVFKDYDEHLIFESMNENFDGSYNGPSKYAYDNINDYNQIFVDAVRQSGGNNDKRWLLMPGWNTNIDQTVDDFYVSGIKFGFKIPEDTHLSKDVPTGEKRIMISVHYYDPWDFAGEGKATQWGDYVTDSSKTAGWGDKFSMKAQLEKLQNKFTSQGYPVVIGEYGATNVSAKDPQNLTCRKDYYKSMCEYSIKYGCIPVAWDNQGLGRSGADQFGLFNRKTFQPTEEGAEIIASIMSAYNPDVARTEAVTAANAVIASAAAYQEAEYTPETWSVYVTALAAVNALLANPDAAAWQIKDATDELNKAIAALVKKPQTAVTPTPPTGGVIDTPQPPEPEPEPVVEVAKAKIKKVSSPKKATVKITWKKVADASGYEVKLGTDKKIKKSVKKVTVKKAGTTSTTVKKLKSKKTYYVKIRAYVTNDGKKTYGAWSAVKTVKVK